MQPTDITITLVVPTTFPPEATTSFQVPATVIGGALGSTLFLIILLLVVVIIIAAVVAQRKKVAAWK